MKNNSGVRQVWALGMVFGLLATGFGAVLPAQAGDEHAVYYSACVKQSGNTHLCACLADLAMAADPQLRSDMIMSMSSPGKYRSTRAPHVPNGGPEMQAWEKFDVDGNKKCGMDI